MQNVGKNYEILQYKCRLFPMRNGFFYIQFLYKNRKLPDMNIYPTKCIIRFDNRNIIEFLKLTG